jgi:hypothetical protein
MTAQLECKYLHENGSTESDFIKNRITFGETSSSSQITSMLINDRMLRDKEAKFTGVA